MVPLARYQASTSFRHCIASCLPHHHDIDTFDPHFPPIPPRLLRLLLPQVDTMGVMSVTSETIFNYPPDVIYDFVGNPVNWGRTYKGSAGLPSDAKKLNLPLKVGDVWTEKVALAENTYHAKWVLEIADRGRKFAFRQVSTSHECGTKPNNALGSIRLLFSR